MGRSTSGETDYVGLAFVYQDDDERRRLESTRLIEQEVDILDCLDQNK